MNYCTCLFVAVLVVNGFIKSLAGYRSYPPEVQVDLCADPRQLHVIFCEQRTNPAGWVESTGKKLEVERVLEVNLSTGGFVSMSSSKEYNITSGKGKRIYLHLTGLSIRDNGTKIACYDKRRGLDTSVLDYTTVIVTDCKSTEIPETTPVTITKPEPLVIIASTKATESGTPSRETTSNNPKWVTSGTELVEKHSNHDKHQVRKENVTPGITKVSLFIPVCLSILVVVLFILMMVFYLLYRKERRKNKDNQQTAQYNSSSSEVHDGGGGDSGDGGETSPLAPPCNTLTSV